MGDDELAELLFGETFGQYGARKGKDTQPPVEDEGAEDE